MNFKITASLIAILSLVLIQSCTIPNPYQQVNNNTNNNTGVDDDDNESGGNSGSTTGNTGGTNSTIGSNRSHNIGQDCLNCHKPGGGEAPTWRVGGTVYNEGATLTNPNAIIKLYTGPNGTGTLKYILNVDAKGNFYTSGTIDFTGGLYPAATGSTGTNYMSFSTTNGACNSCHTGTTTGRIWTN